MNSLLGKTAIDTAIFTGSNMLVHKIADSPNVDLEDIAIFGIADFLTRSGYATFISSYITQFGDKTKINVVSALLYLLGSTGIDILQKREFKHNLMKNFYKASIGLAGNVGVDMLLPSSFDQYK